MNEDNCRHGMGIDECVICATVNETEEICRWALKVISREEDGICEETRQDIIFEFEKAITKLRGIGEVPA